ncbi:hypothetical protein PoB_001201200 [Plakobranchus ocellatus]|uniref:Uncharacterized protein n=1 Tax=Plakobranchus ocellatus TaxID=259542 RepID=A0AAV3YTQ3_9GAST|nr:hypothetical protein PoB_001201200 [Plakobranchus ocellatus]
MVLPWNCSSSCNGCLKSRNATSTCSSGHFTKAGNYHGLFLCWPLSQMQQSRIGQNDEDDDDDDGGGGGGDGGGNGDDDNDENHDDDSNNDDEITIPKSLEQKRRSDEFALIPCYFMIVSSNSPWLKGLHGHATMVLVLVHLTNLLKADIRLLGLFIGQALVECTTEKSLQVVPWTLPRDGEFMKTPWRMPNLESDLQSSSNPTPHPSPHTHTQNHLIAPTPENPLLTTVWALTVTVVKS